MTKIRNCIECGEPFEIGKRASKEFCSQGCKRKFHHRRRERGAILYDLLMAWRHDREAAEKAGVWPAVARLAAFWRDEDRVEREGRKSYRPPARVLDEVTFMIVPQRFTATGRWAQATPQPPRK